jgi:hypothetical protein
MMAARIHDEQHTNKLHKSTYLVQNGKIVDHTLISSCTSMVVQSYICNFIYAEGWIIKIAPGANLVVVVFHQHNRPNGNARNDSNC